MRKSFLHIPIFPAVAFCTIVFCSCTVTKNISSARVYHDSVYQQFWTADWSPDDRFIAVGGGDSLLRIFQGRNLKLRRTSPVNSWIHSVKWHPDGKVLAIATLDRYVLLWNAENGA